MHKITEESSTLNKKVHDIPMNSSKSMDKGKETDDSTEKFYDQQIFRKIHYVFRSYLMP